MNVHATNAGWRQRHYPHIERSGRPAPEVITSQLAAENIAPANLSSNFSVTCKSVIGVGAPSIVDKLSCRDMSVCVRTQQLALYTKYTAAGSRTRLAHKNNHGAHRSTQQTYGHCCLTFQPRRPFCWAWRMLQQSHASMSIFWLSMRPSGSLNRLH